MRAIVGDGSDIDAERGTTSAPEQRARSDVRPFKRIPGAGAGETAASNLEWAHITAAVQPNSNFRRALNWAEIVARVLGPRLRVGGRERVRAVRVRGPARAGSDQPGGAGQCALAARGRTRGRQDRAGTDAPRTFVAGISLAKTLTFLVVAPEEFG